MNKSQLLQLIQALPEDVFLRKFDAQVQVLGGYRDSLGIKQTTYVLTVVDHSNEYHKALALASEAGVECSYELHYKG